MHKHIPFLAFLLTASLIISCTLEQSTVNDVYLDEKAPIERRVEDLMSKLTLDEKIGLMRSLSPSIERLGIDKYYHGNEALHGVIRPDRFTVYPQAIALASMWDPALVEEISGTISDEARARWNVLDQGRLQTLSFADLLTFWSPTVNMARDPRWGRTAETYGEDPFLSGQTGAAFVRGLQGYDKRYLKVVSTPKHFTANNEEHNRFSCNADIPEKMLREYFLPAFEACVTEGHAQSIMAAYNKINGMPCSCNHWLLTDLLRNEWGFDGYVVSDCGGVSFLYSAHKYAKTKKEAASLALKAGLDLECGDNIYIEPLQEAYDEGLVSIEDIDRAVRRILTARMRLGMFDNPEHNPYAQIPESVIGCQRHQDLALKSARESIVLLKNDGILPLDRSKLKKVAVVGINADKCELGDYSGVPTILPKSILQSVRDICKDDVEVLSVPWTTAGNGMELMDENCFADGITAEYFSDTYWGTKTFERKEKLMYFEPGNQAPDPHIPVHKMSARWSGSFAAEIEGRYDFNIEHNGGSCKVFIDGKQVMGSGCPDNCSFTFKKGSEHKIVMEYNINFGISLLKLNWRKPDSQAEDVYAEAIEAARESDVVIAAMGYNMTIEREGLDRPDLNLPADQEAFLKSLKEVNPNVVLVLVAGNSLALNWEDENLPAIVESWYGGEYGGQAVAEVLFGECNPSGKLPLTFYKGVDQLPPFNDYQVTNGRTYKYLEEEPLYEFGYGLSYTTFEYSDLKVSRHGKGWNVKFDVANTGDMAGDEVTQVYVRIPDYEGKKPVKELKGFARVSLNPGEKKAVTVFIPGTRLRFWSDSEHRFKFSSLKPEVLVGSSSSDIRLTSDENVLKTDVCVYGGTSAAVTAARAAAEAGSKVIIICPDPVLGGMTTGGLGATDIGNKQAIIGMARQFYRDLGKHYGVEEQWTFEPSVAQSILDSYVDNPNISIYKGYYLSSVKKKGTRIVSITCKDENGRNAKTVKADSFIDTGYEGDLLAMAGVSYHVGREDSSVYGEKWNGSHLSYWHQFPDGIDPYVEKGNPASGLLWGIQDWKMKAEGAGDNYVQAYNFRICFSNDPDNQIPITKPDDYDPSMYELLGRVCEADTNPTVRNYLGWSNMPNGKTDVNNCGAFSTDMIGMNHDYPEATWERRKEIIAAHKSYTLGLFWFLYSDPRVPKEVQDFIRQWGYAKDEYPATGGWTHQIYVREARRMISDYVATQADCEGKGNVTDGIGYAAYQMDSHNCERIIIEKDGKMMVKNEGDVEKGGGKPYPISYRSITPKRTECTNLLVPVCLSASHIAFGSIRMEPVYLELGQVCGIAASLAGRKPVQDVNISLIQEAVGYPVN